MLRLTARSTLLLVTLVGCDDGMVTTDAGEPQGDAGMAVTQISYTPEGCGYVVATPVVRDTGMSEDVFGASDAIDHVHVSWAGPSHSSFAVNWRADGDTLASNVLYGTDQAAVAAADTADGTDVLLQVGHHMAFREIGALARVHEVHVCGLEASTTYYYKVGGPGHWSEVFDTTTAPTPGSIEPFTFGVTGDSRNNLENAWPISQRRMQAAAIDFEVFSGDAVLAGTNQADWNDFLGASDGTFGVQDLLARRAMMVVNGNHEGLAVNYIAQFALPQEVSDSEVAQGEEWYSFDYGNAHFVMLNDSVADSSVIAGSQAAWLRRDLMQVDRNLTPWVFAVHHRPIYTCGSTHGPYREGQTAWQPIYDEMAVDIVFNGHNHAYERSLPIRGLSAGEGVVVTSGPDATPMYDAEGLPTGTVYIVAAGAGADLYPAANDCPTSHIGESVRPYAIVSIEDRTLTYTAYSIVDGTMLDTFTLTK
ncbi:MAG: purple acid phosphatase family protein [Sandaracinaceae bacterium]